MTIVPFREKTKTKRLPSCDTIQQLEPGHHRSIHLLLAQKTIKQTQKHTSKKETQTHQHTSKQTNKPGVLEAAGLLASRGFHVEAPRRAVIGAPHRPALLFTSLPVDWLPVTTVLRTVPVQDINHVLQPVPRAEPFLYFLKGDKT